MRYKVEIVENEKVIKSQDFMVAVHIDDWVNENAVEGNLVRIYKNGSIIRGYIV